MPPTEIKTNPSKTTAKNVRLIGIIAQEIFYKLGENIIGDVDTAQIASEAFATCGTCGRHTRLFAVYFVKSRHALLCPAV